MNTNDILQNGRPVTVRLLDGTAAEFKARMLTIDQWSDATKYLNDELALTAFIFGRAKDWLKTIFPADYKKLRAAAQEVNAEGFFDFAVGERDRLRAEQQSQIAAFAQLPAETVALAVQEGQRLSSASSPIPRPR